MLRRFGFVLAGVLVFFTAVFLVKKPGSFLVPLFGGGASLAVLVAVFRPQALDLVEKMMRKFGEGVGWINTRVILVLLFYLVFIPIGWIMRIAGKHTIKTEIDRRAGSYWQDYEHLDAPERYPRQF